MPLVSPPALLDATLPISEGNVTNLTADLAARTAKATLTTKGDIYAASAASTPARVAVGADATVLTADAASAAGVKWAPSGGSTPGAARVLGPFPFAFDTANLLIGATFYTPTIDDVLLDGWVEVDTAWNGTTPLCDIGTLVPPAVTGLFSFGAGALDMTLADAENAGRGHGLLFGDSQPSALYLASVNDVARAPVPSRFVSAAPLNVWVTSDGTTNGSNDPGSTQGAAAIYLIVATPSLT